ncbi:MAG: hypothetical protein ACJAZ3_001658 [Sphingobacteriales bacterium]|jgi:hypothetical protein
MKLLKYIGTGVAVVLGLALIIAVFVTKDFIYEKTITINAPVDSVWQNVNSLAAMDSWNPRSAKDLNIEQVYSGTTGEIGESLEWNSVTKQVGKGVQTIVKIEAPLLIETELKFLTPYESEVTSYVQLQATSAGTDATWGFKSTIPYPFNLMSLIMNAEEQLGPDFQKGLDKLKNISE